MDWFGRAASWRTTMKENIARRKIGGVWIFAGEEYRQVGPATLAVRKQQWRDGIKKTEKRQSYMLRLLYS